MNQPEPRDLPRDILLDSVVVLRYEKRSKSENKGKVPTKMELVLEQTQQGTSYEVSGISDESVSKRSAYNILTSGVTSITRKVYQDNGWGFAACNSVKCYGQKNLNLYAHQGTILFGIVGVTDKCLEALSKSCSNTITTLDVNGCIGIKKSSREELLQLFPYVRCFKVHN
ncbi:hypothetical protein Tco_0000234 [Tanacetum coccineum]